MVKQIKKNLMNENGLITFQNIENGVADVHLFGV